MTGLACSADRSCSAVPSGSPVPPRTPLTPTETYFDTPKARSRSGKSDNIVINYSNNYRRFTKPGGALGNEGKAARRCRIELLGPLRIRGPEGEDLTPTGAKTQGLVALLAVARGKGCSRAWLQDKLWSDRSQVQGRNSLKKALSELRAALGDYHERVLVTRAGHVELSAAAISIDIFDGPEPGRYLPLVRPDFLEGIDIRDSEFDLWLQAIRAALAEQGGALPEAQPAAAVAAEPHTGELPRPTPLAAPLPRVSCFCVGLLPVVAPNGDGAAGLIADLLLDRFAVALVDRGTFTVFDYRKARLPDDAGPGSLDLTFRVRSLTAGGQVLLQFIAERVSDHAVVWGGAHSLALAAFDEQDLAAQVSRMADQLADAVLRTYGPYGEPRHEAAGLVLHGIDQMFRITAQNLDAAEASFRRAVELDPKGQYYAWYAYLSAFRVEEAKGSDSPDLRERASELIRRSLEADPASGLSLGLLTHVYSFVFRDYERAFHLADTALSMGADSAMLHDSRAMLHFYTGDLTSARASAERAMARGVLNPYRYSFATSLCMISAVMGDYAGAAANGERALAMHPAGSSVFFEPTLRYLAATYGHLDRPGPAAQVVRQLRGQDPTISARSLAEARYPVPSAAALETLRSGFQILEKMEL